MSIALCPREKIFKAYIELELQLGNVDKCRKIYEKFIMTHPDNSSAWVKYAELEKSLEEYDRCIAIFQTAISQPLDMPEIVWKAYINVEISHQKYENVRNLYEILLEKTRHVKVWLSYAKFEIEIEEYEKSRDIFDRAYKYFKENNLKEERLMILENWIKSEEQLEIEENEELIKKLYMKRPEKVKKRRKVRKGYEEEGLDNNNEMANDEDGWEEYYDYIFPDDEDNKKNFKILSHALKWHQENKATN